MDWERRNFSLSQCLFTENSKPALVAIEAAPAASNSDVPTPPTPKASSGHGKTIGIAVGVTVPVIVIAILFSVVLCFRRRRKSPTVSKSSRSQENLANGQQRSSAKELNAKENAIHELDGPRHVQANTSRPLPPWVAEKEDFSGDRTGVDQAVSEPSQSEPLLGSVHEMYGSPASPVELPDNSLRELAGSPITRNVSSASSHRRSRGFFQSRSSTPGLLPSPASGASPNPIAGGPPTSNRSTTSSPPANEVFSPISPIAEQDNSTGQGRLESVFRGFSQPGASSQQASDDQQPSHSNI